MLIEIDNWTRDVLNNTTDYIIKPRSKYVEHKWYLDKDDLVQTIADLTDELDRQCEKVLNMDSSIQVYFKGRDVLKLSPREIEKFRQAEEILEEDLDLKDDGTILKEQFCLMIEELVDKICKQQLELEKRDEIIKEINESKGW